MDPVRLGFVAGRDHDSHADDHRAAAQTRIVPLLDRREEGVDVGMEDRRLTHEHMFADLEACSCAPERGRASILRLRPDAGDRRVEERPELVRFSVSTRATLKAETAPAPSMPTS